MNLVYAKVLSAGIGTVIWLGIGLFVVVFLLHFIAEIISTFFGDE